MSTSSIVFVGSGFQRQLFDEHKLFPEPRDEQIRPCLAVALFRLTRPPLSQCAQRRAFVLADQQHGHWSSQCGAEPLL